MKLGKFNIDAVETGIFALDGGAMFGVIPKALWSRLYDEGDTKNRIPLAARPMLIRTDEKTILIDTGNGTKFDDKFAKIYNIDREKSSIDFALKPHGVTPEDITDVILTHLHFDHAGGATVKNGDKLEPAFPNAKYYVQKDHLAWARNPSEKDQASFLPENYEPIASEGMLEIIDGEGEILPGISSILVHGHTKAQQLIKIADGDQSIVFCGDLLPTSAHIGLPYVMGYDNYPMQTIDEKKRLIPEFFEQSTILFFEHDAYSQAAKLEPYKNFFKASEPIVVTNFEIK